MTDRPRMETRQQGEERLLVILAIVENGEPMTLEAILAELADTPFACSERHLRRHTNLLIRHNRLAYDIDAKMFAVKRVLTR